MRYKAFISYSHQDSPWADWLHRSLERYRIDSRLVSELNLSGNRLYPVFRDRSDLGTSPSLPEAIREALSQSDTLIVVCSPASANSRWVNEEVAEFIRLGRRDRIICLLVDGGWGADSFPADLVAERPLAADVRPQGDGKFNALLKVISGMLQVPYDRLGRRELRRRRKQLAAVTFLSLLIISITSTLAIYAWIARQDAERRLQQSEDLISFMLEDLRERLEPLGRLDVLDAVGIEAMDYFASLKLKDVGPETLVKNAVALRQIGEVRSSQGNMDAALEAFRESLAMLEFARDQDQDNVQTIFQLAQTRFWIADVHYQRLDYAAASEEIRQYRDLALRMVELEPGKIDHEMEVAFAENNLGALAVRTNDPAQAREHFLAALEIKQSLLDRDPENPRLRVEVTVTMSWIGSVETSVGNMSAAIGWHKRQIAELEVLLQQEPDMRYLEKLALARRKLAEDLFQSNITELAELEERKTVAIYRELVAHDPENAVWRGELYTSLLNLTNVLLVNGSPVQVDALLREAIEGLDRELSISPENGRLQLQRAIADICQAKWQVIQGGSSAEHAASAIARLRPLLKAPYDVDVHHEFARAAYVLAESESSVSGDQLPSSMGEETGDVVSEALLALDQLQDNEIETVALRALLLASVGREDEAHRIINPVLDTEYRAPEYLNGSPLRSTLYGAR